MSHPARSAAGNPPASSATVPYFARPGRRHRAGVVAVAGVVALGAAVATSTAATAAPAGAPEAVDYLVGQLVDGDHVESDGFVQYGQTLDVAFGLASAGGAQDTLDAVLDYMTSAETVGAYTQGVPFDGADAAYAGATAKLGLASALLGVDPTEVGGTDLVAQLQSLEASTGRFSDRSDYGDFSNVLGQSFGVLFLTAANGVEPSDAAVQFLQDAQCDDGGFPVDFGTTGADCVASPDATGLAIQALNADDPDEGATGLPAEREAALVAAVRWLESARDADGAWLAFGVPNVNATAYAAMGLLGVDQTAELSVSWLAGLQLPDGGLPLTPTEDTSNLFATAQALPALVSTSFVTLDEGILAPTVAVPAVAPTPTPTDPSPSPTTPTTAPPTVTPTPSATPTDPGTTSPGTTLPGAPSTPAGPQPTLPMTGGDGSTIGLIGLTLLAAGASVLLVARRALSRP